ncbi:MAG: hypothetical protein U9N44_02640 [Chloroflexota bacterium]|nr:hypothetical protein [Chloroflexota bacterium]
MYRLKNWRTTLSIVIILGVIVAVYWLTMFDTFSDEGYNSAAGQIAEEVADYRDAHDGDLPTSGTSIALTEPAGTYFIIDICELMNNVPEGCAAIEGEDNDNCDAGDCQCDAGAHYLWAVDSYGEVFSKCIGDQCDSNDTDGYRGVWP